VENTFTFRLEDVKRGMQGGCRPEIPRWKGDMKVRVGNPTRQKGWEVPIVAGREKRSTAHTREG